MSKLNLNSIGKLVVLVAVFALFVGCSSDTMTGPSTNNGISSSPIVGERGNSNKVTFEGQTQVLDRAERTFVLRGEKELTVYVPEKAKIVKVPEGFEVPFNPQSSKATEVGSRSEYLEGGLKVRVTGELKGDDYIIAESVEIFSFGNEFEVGFNNQELN